MVRRERVAKHKPAASSARAVFFLQYRLTHGVVSCPPGFNYRDLQRPLFNSAGVTCSAST